MKCDFGEPPASAAQRRPIAWHRGRKGCGGTYKTLAAKYGVKWKGRRYKPTEWDSSDIPNPVFVRRNRLLVRHNGSSNSGGRLRASRGLHPYRQASVVRV